MSRLRSFQTTLWLGALVWIVTGGCCPNAKVTTTPSGSMLISVIEADQLFGGADGVVTVTYSGSAISTTSDQGEAVFSAERKYERKNGTITPTPELQRVNLRQGLWNVQVSSGAWSASCQGEIGTTNAAHLTFKAGQGGCTGQ